MQVASRKQITDKMGTHASDLDRMVFLEIYFYAMFITDLNLASLKYYKETVGYIHQMTP